MKHKNRLFIPSVRNYCMALVSVACLHVSTGYSQTLFSEDFENGMDRWTGRFQGPTTAHAVDDPLNSGHGKVMWFGDLSSGGDAFTRETITITSKVLIEFDYLGIIKPGSITNDLGGFFGIANDFDASTLQNWLATTSIGFTNSVQLIDDGQWHHVTVNLEPYSISPFHLVLQDYMYSWGVPGDVYFDNITVSYPTVKTNATVAPPIADMVGWWQGDDNAIDVISGQSGSLFGTNNFATGQVNDAFNFNGIDNYVVIPYSTNHSVTNFTIEGWINPADISKPQPILEFSETTGSVGVHIWLSVNGYTAADMPGDLYFNFREGTPQGVRSDHVMQSTNNIIKSNQWQHIAATYDKSSGTGSMYLNGKLVMASKLGTFTPMTAYPILLGHRSISSPDGLQGLSFKGKFDELSLYNRALKENEINEIYQSGAAGKANFVIPSQLASANATIVNGFVVSVDVKDRGEGYVTPPEITFVGGGGSGAYATAVLTNGTIDHIVVLDAGSGYTSAPTVVISSPSQPVITELMMIPRIKISGAIGSTNVLYYCDDLNTNWNSLATFVITNSASYYFDQTAVGSPKRFYKVIPAQ